MTRLTIQVQDKGPQKKPVLYDASGTPLERRNPVGFSPPEAPEPDPERGEDGTQEGSLHGSPYRVKR